MNPGISKRAIITPGGPAKDTAILGERIVFEGRIWVARAAPHATDALMWRCQTSSVAQPYSWLRSWWMP